MAIRQRGQVTLYDFTDKYTVDLPGSISLAAGVGSDGLTGQATRVISTPIKRGNTALTTATTDPTIQLSGTPTVTVVDCLDGGKSGSTLYVNIQAGSVSFDTPTKLLYFTLVFDQRIVTDGAAIIAISFSDTATGDSITLNEQINFSLSHTGARGIAGINTATVFLYKRSQSSPDKPTSNITYTFATSTATGTDIGTNKWTQAIPSGNDTLYAIYATASSNEATDTIASSEWQGPIQVDGTEGVDGWNRAIVYLYQRSASAPSLPTGTQTYTFSTGAITGGNIGNWVASMPGPNANGDPCWVCSASFASQAATATASFQNVIKLVEDGQDGQDSFVISITSDPTDRFVNTRIACTLTAHVSKGGVEYADIPDGDDVDTQLAHEGLIVKWYLADDNPWNTTGNNPTQRTHVVQTITAGEVSDSISLVAKLEDIQS